MTESSDVLSLRLAGRLQIAPAIDLRPPALVMCPERLGCLYPSRLSFSRSLIRRIQREGWRIEQRYLDVDSNNLGEALYKVRTPGQDYIFFGLAHAITPEQRTDRAIAQFWDYTFVLCEGELDQADMERLRRNVPLQDEGRYLATDIVFSRANKSARLFASVVDALSRGEQPDSSSIADVGYLLRTTAVFANGKFGIADYEALRARPEGLSGCFEAQMLIVYLIRQFSLDLVNHVAHLRAPDSAVKLARPIQHLIGVGNATGLGMVPFLVDHPTLLNAWIGCREEALRRVRALPEAGERNWTKFLSLVDRAVRHVAVWKTDDRRQDARLDLLSQELQSLKRFACRWDSWPPSGHPWNSVVEHASRYSTETQEMVISLLLEVHGELIDDLEARLSVPERGVLEPDMLLATLVAAIEHAYPWAIGIDFSESKNAHYFWYRSAVKAEPRLGVRGRDAGADKEMTVAVARDIAALYDDLIRLPAEERRATLVAAFLLVHPEHRAATERVVSLRGLPYSEIRGNLIAADFLAIDLLRCKLAILGAGKFDPKSDRWVRVVFFHGAPVASDLEARLECDDWLFPDWCAS